MKRSICLLGIIVRRVARKGMCKRQKEHHGTAHGRMLNAWCAMQGGGSSGDGGGAAKEEEE